MSHAGADTYDARPESEVPCGAGYRRFFDCHIPGIEVNHFAVSGCMSQELLIVRS